jgi:hypothetical protein
MVILGYCRPENMQEMEENINFVTSKKCNEEDR